MYLFDADHTSSRPYHWYEMAARFIYRKLGIDARPRFYEKVYGQSKLYIGDQAAILEELSDPTPDMSVPG
jgi:hypothetical protein